MSDFGRAVMWGCGIFVGLALAGMLLGLGTCTACVVGMAGMEAAASKNATAAIDCSTGEAESAADSLPPMPGSVTVIGEGRVSSSPLGELLDDVVIPDGTVLFPMEQEFESQRPPMIGVRYWRVRYGERDVWISEFFTDTARSYPR